MPPCARSLRQRPTLFEQQFSSARIGREVLALYRRMLDNGLAPRSIASPRGGRASAID
jgi:hypothetical protein